LFTNAVEIVWLYRNTAVRRQPLPNLTHPKVSAFNVLNSPFTVTETGNSLLELCIKHYCGYKLQLLVTKGSIISQGSIHKQRVPCPMKPVKVILVYFLYKNKWSSHNFQ